jgi:predicted nucleotidyltransferase
MKDAAWNVAAVELLPKDLLDRLQAWMEKIVSSCGLSDLVADVEVCGSYAYGCATDVSDIDVAIAGTDPKAQDKISRMLSFNSDYGSLLQAARDDLKIKLEVGSRNCDNKSYNTCYSLRERKLYGRAVGEVQNIRRRFNQATQKWELVDKAPLAPKAPAA